jgi:hypothetical protein
MSLKSLLKRLIVEQVSDCKSCQGKKPRLNEVDWSKFPDMLPENSCLSSEDVVNFLNRTKERMDKGIPITNKKHIKDVIITKGTIQFLIDEDGNINVDKFAKLITQIPKTIIDRNPKAEKSDIGRPQLTVNTGIPALFAIIYDKNTDRFHTISTCPSAGTCLEGCFARKNFYLFNDGKVIKLTQRINLLMNNPELYEKLAYSELLTHALEAQSEGKTFLIRWNDAGDFYTDTYLNIAKNITKKFLDEGFDTKSYAYTKRGKYVMELNDEDKFVIQFSTDAKSKDVQQIKDFGLQKVKLSHRIPSFVFKGIFNKPEKGKLNTFKNGKAGEKELKDKVYDYIMKDKRYDFSFVTRDSLVFTWELPYQESTRYKYNLIVLPNNDSDIGAQRRDVQVSFLCEH